MLPFAMSHITFVTESLQANSLGRPYCLWLLAKHLGWSSNTLTARGERVWGPLRGSEFASTVQRVGAEELTKAIPAGTDLVVACKPLPQSLSIALRAASARRLPLIVDIDDPDLELRLRIGQPLHAALRTIRRPRRSIEDRRNRVAARELPSIVSNPWLADRYGGAIVPHVRPDLGDGAPAAAGGPGVVFVGTNLRHKGVDILREAVDDLRSYGFTLTVTDIAPTDAKPWENWTGQTSLDAGIELVRNADIVALPSRAGRESIGQLPAKLIDAMMLGRAIAVSDVAPMPWAIGDAGIVFEHGSRGALKAALLTLLDPAKRAELGARARTRALSEFTVEAVATRFERACLDAVDNGPITSGQSRWTSV